MSQGSKLALGVLCKHHHHHLFILLARFKTLQTVIGTLQMARVRFPTVY